jgi:hypothetical protein
VALKVRTFFVGACLAAAVWPGLAMFASPRAGDADAPLPAAGPRSSIEWPTHFRGRPLTHLARTPVETRFAARFPGAVARFAVDGGREVLIARHVVHPTRMLHPARDCFRAVGYAVMPARAAVDEDGLRWSCFVAAREGRRLRVCERIHDAGQRAWTDVSSWYWAAMLDRGGDSGPWRALTLVTPIDDAGDLR